MQPSGFSPPLIFFRSVSATNRGEGGNHSGNHLPGRLQPHLKYQERGPVAQSSTFQHAFSPPLSVGVARASPPPMGGSHRESQMHRV